MGPLYMNGVLNIRFTCTHIVSIFLFDIHQKFFFNLKGVFKKSADNPSMPKSSKSSPNTDNSSRF